MAIIKSRYALRAHREIGFDEAVAAVKDAFKAEGFVSLTQIDVQAMMKEKLGADMVPYLILGMCNPQLAHTALELEPEIGVMLPCNVVIYERDGGVTIVAQDPGVMVEMTGNDSLKGIADEAKAAIERALATI